MTDNSMNWRDWVALAAVPWLAAAPVALVARLSFMRTETFGSLLYPYLLAVAPALAWALAMALVLLECRRRSIVPSGLRLVVIGALVMALLGSLPALLRDPALGSPTDSPYEGLTLHHEFLSLGWVAELVQILLVCGAAGAWCGAVLVLVRKVAVMGTR